MCSEVVPIRLDIAPQNVPSLNNEPYLFIKNNLTAGCLWWFRQKVISLAKDDGFDGYEDFTSFFKDTYKLKPGDSKGMVIIKWKEFKKADQGA